MKLLLFMKTPDVLDDAIREELQNQSLTDYEIEDKSEEVKKICEKWFRCGETLTIEIDTEAETCEVIPAN